MVDEIPHDGAPPEVPPMSLPMSPPVAEVEETVIVEAGGAADDIEADLEAEFAPEFEPKPLPLRVRPFNLVTYHLCTDILPPGGIRRFSDFAHGVPEDLLLREPTSYLSSIEGDSHSYRGYGATTARDWYDELHVGVRDIIDKTSRPLLGALMKRWWDTTNSFHLSTAGEMTMTPYDFAMITGLGVGSDPIPFDTDIGEWEAAWINLLGARTRLYRPAMVRYSWFAEQFRGSEPETLEEMG
ncbi:hypothetical protein ACSBR2_015463 [Camellia fascicularis]